MTTESVRPNGIAGLEGKEPIGAVLTVGHKGPSGNPTDTDRFFLVQPVMNQQSIRPQHPAFSAFNAAEPDKRQAMRGYLVHAEQRQCFEYNLHAQILGRGFTPHPSKAPACIGDGKRAQRWIDGKYKDIPCPNDLCEFRQAPEKGPTTCKPFARFLFRPRWADGSPLPAPLTKLTTGSWNSVRALVGFFDYISEQAKMMGLDSFSLYGLPFQLVLSRKSVPQKQRAFPVLSISVDGDLQAFFAAQAQRRKEFGDIRPLAALTDGSQQEWDEIAADAATISPGIPKEVVTINVPSKDRP